jgi:hypothetical protein
MHQELRECLDKAHVINQDCLITGTPGACGGGTPALLPQSTTVCTRRYLLNIRQNFCLPYFPYFAKEGGHIMSKCVYSCVHASKFRFTGQILVKVGVNIIPLEHTRTCVIQYPNTNRSDTQAVTVTGLCDPPDVTRCQNIFRGHDYFHEAQSSRRRFKSPRSSFIETEYPLPCS